MSQPPAHAGVILTAAAAALSMWVFPGEQDSFIELAVLRQIT